MSAQRWLCRTLHTTPHLSQQYQTVQRAAKAILGICGLLLGTLTIAGALAKPAYSSDSWMYWDLAKSIFGDFYRIPITRAYQEVTPWSNAFPPLWPALNAIVSRLLSTGPATLLLTNALVLGLLFVTLGLASSMLFGSSIPGLVSFVVFFTDTSWRDELIGGRPIPFQITLMALLLATLTGNLRPVVRYGVAGLLLGLMLATKFDVMPLVAVCILYILARSGRYLPLFAVMAILPPLPWAWFSWTHFGDPFSSDGSRIASSVDPTAYTTDFRLSWAPALRDDPAAWFQKIPRHLHEMVWSFDASWSLGELLIVAMGLIAAVAIIAHRTVRKPSLAPDTVSRSLALIVVSVGLTAMLTTYVATGFVDKRYFAPHRWFAVFIALGAIWHILEITEVAVLAPAVFTLFGVTATFVLVTPMIAHEKAWHPSSAYESNAENGELLACLDRIPATRLLFLDDNEAAARFAAQTGRQAGMLPLNFQSLGPDQRRTFLDRFNFGAVTWQSDAGARRASEIGTATLAGCPTLRTIDR